MQLIRLFALFLLGLYITLKHFEYSFFHCTLLVSWIVIFIFTFIKDIISCFKNDEILAFKPSIISIILILVFTFIFKSKETKVLLSAKFTNYDKAYGLIFKEDNTFTYLTLEMIDKPKYSYGKYELKNNRIILDKEIKDNVIKTKYFLLESMSVGIEKDSVKNYLFQIDSNANKIINAAKFTIDNDNR